MLPGEELEIMMIFAVLAIILFILCVMLLTYCLCAAAKDEDDDAQKEWIRHLEEERKASQEKENCED